MSNINDVVNKFLENPKRMEMGAGKLSKRWDCTKEDIYEARKIARKQIKKIAASNMPKILVFDIETSPLKAFVWQMQVWKASVSPEKVISEWFMLTWSAKWLFSNETMSDRLTSKEAKAENDKRLVKGLWNLLNEADVVIAHNGDRFDVPNMNTRFLVNGLPPVSPYQTIDTNRVARKHFGFTHNALNALATIFGFEQKIGTDFDLWVKCLDGDEESLKYMEKYNRYDVELLEDVYLKLRPWIRPHINVGLYIESDSHVCPSCGSQNLKEDGNYYTNTSRFTAHKCGDCGAVSRERTNNYNIEKRKNLLTSIAR